VFNVTVGGKSVPASDVKITKILNDYWTADFKVPNLSEYRDIIGTTEKDVIIKLSGVTKFTGKLTIPKLKSDTIECYCLDSVQRAMEKASFTGQYAAVAVNTIMTAICAAAGVTWGSNITYNRNLQFNDALCLYAAIIVCIHCGTSGTESTPLDWWTDATKIYIGQKGSSKGTISLAGVGEKTTDYEKMKSKVTSRAWNTSGTELTYSKGSGADEYTFKDKNIYQTLSDLKDSQKQITYRMYLKRTEPIIKVPAKIDILVWEEKELDVGDTITVVDEQTVLDGSYRIARAVIKEGMVDVDLVSTTPFNELLPDLAADPQADPSETNLPATASPGEGVVAANASLSWNQKNCPDTQFTDLLTTPFNIPNEDIDVLFIRVTLRDKRAIGNYLWGTVRITVFKSPTTYYLPNGTTGVVLYGPMPRAQAGSYGTSYITVSIPRNVKGGSIGVEWKPAVGRGGDYDCDVIIWGHAPHTHAIVDAKHENVMTDKRQVAREEL